MLKKTLLLLATSLVLLPTANAGVFKKALIGTGVVAGGVVAYKMAKKLNVGGLTENLANHIDNAPKTLDETPSFIPKVKEDLTSILNDPEATPEDLRKYVVLDDLMKNRYGGGTVITSPERQAVIDILRNGETPKNVTQKNPVNVSGGSLNVTNDEKKLEENMKKAGLGAKPNGYKAFHIVSTNDVNFKEARNILTSAGIDLNAADNGIYLPTGNTKGDEVHTSQLEGNISYAQYVTNLLKQNNGNKKGLNNALGDLFLKLSSGDAKF